MLLYCTVLQSQGYHIFCEAPTRNWGNKWNINESSLLFDVQDSDSPRRPQQQQSFSFMCTFKHAVTLYIYINQT